jgi:hypothetical protein
MYEVRDRYFFYVPEFEEFTGQVVKNPSWLDDDYITMTTGNPTVPLRMIRKDTVLGFQAPAKVQKNYETFVVKSSSRKGGDYTVTRSGKTWSCTCVGFGFHKSCRHIKEIKSCQ